MDKYKSTITDTSKSKKGEKFIESDINVYDFDNFTQDLCSKYRHKHNFYSVDAFAFSDKNEFWFIEFKNAVKSRFPKKWLRPKAMDSLYTAYFFFNQQYSLEELKKNSVFIVVYNDDNREEIHKENPSEDFEKLKNKMATFANVQNETRILFDIEDFKGFLYKDVITIGNNEFMEKYASKCHL